MWIVNWKRVLIGKWSWKRPFISLLWIYVLLGVVAVFFGDRLLFMPPVPSYERENKDLNRIRGMDTPLLVIHGENDEVIPVSHGRKLVEASLATDKHFSMVAGAGHNDLFEIAGEDIIQQVAEFARRVKIGQGPRKRDRGELGPSVPGP